MSKIDLDKIENEAIHRAEITCCDECQNIARVVIEDTINKLRNALAKKEQK